MPNFLTTKMKCTMSYAARRDFVPLAKMEEWRQEVCFLSRLRSNTVSMTSPRNWPCWFSSRLRSVRVCSRSVWNTGSFPCTQITGPSVREIYAEGIVTGNATFETELPDWEKWDGNHCKNCRLVALERFEDSADVALPPCGSSRLGRPQPGLKPPCLCGGDRGAHLCCGYRTRTRRGEGIAGGVLESEAQGIWTYKQASFPRTYSASDFTSPAGSAR
jgi:hypothetical protein